MAARRDGNQSGSKPRRKPASQGHPSQGRPTVGGGTKGRKPTVYRSPTPSPTPAPVSDVRTRGDKAPRGSGYSTRKQRIQKNRRERRHALRQLLDSERSGKSPVEYVGMPSPAAAEATAKEDARIRRDIARLRDESLPRHRRTEAAERLADAGVVSSLSELRTRESLKPKKEPKKRLPTRIGTQGLGDIELGGLATPAVKILDEATRPLEFLAGAETAFLKSGGDLSKTLKGGYESGVSRKNRKTSSDVLGELGVPEGKGREIAGFVGDVALDPTTYLTFGMTAAGSVATKAAAKAGEKAGAKALAAGATRKEAKKAASRAAREAYRKAPKNRGLTVGVGERRTSGRTTARVSRALGVPSVARKLSRGRAVEGARKALPIRPHNISEAEWANLKAADRERRGMILHETRRTARRGRAIRKALGGAQRRVLPERATADSPLRVLPRKRGFSEETSAKVRDAIEANDLSNLTPNEARAAKAFMAEQERLLKMRREAGAGGARYQPRADDEPPGYVYRQAAAELEPRGLKRNPRGSAARTTSLKDFARTQRAAMSKVRQDEPGRYVEDLETTLRAKGQKDVQRAANARYRGRVMASGRPLKQGTKWDRASEAIYKVEDNRLVEVDANKTFSPGREHVVLKRAVAEHANTAMETTGRLPFVDPTTNAIKWLLTIPNPQYWARNTYGGVTNAWQSGVPARHILRDTPTAMKVNRRISKRYKAEEQLGASTRSGRAVKVLPKGKSMDVDDFVDELERVNLAGGGQTQELLGADLARRQKAQGFEDFPRLVAYIHARRAGKSPEDSAAFALKSQFDYGDLSHVERAWARRIFPFWTFRSRNVVFQTKTLFTRPGKIANIEKLRDSLASIAGLDEDWQDRLTESEKLGVPFPMPFTMHIPGEGDTPVLIFPALPVTDLNMLSLNFGQLLQQVGGSAHPLPKAGMEFLTGYSVFFRDYIERPYGRWTAAPDYLIEDMPEGMRANLIEDGVIRKGKDRWTGKTTWQWRAKTDYLSNLFPILSVGTAQGTSGRNRSGRNSQQQLFAWLTGLRPKPYVPETNRLYQMYEDREDVRTALEDFSELRVGKGSKEHQRLQADMDRLDEEIYKLEGQLGKKDRGEKPSGLKPRNPFENRGSSAEPNPFKASSGSGHSNPFK